MICDWEKRWRWAFLMIMAAHVLAILLFTRGFLLTRTELPYHSNCSDVKQSPCSSSLLKQQQQQQQQQPQFPPPSPPPPSSSSTSCWTQPSVHRLLIIVLDALRFDFVAPSTFFPEKKPWMDKLTVLQKLASTQPFSARIFKALADPPTTSLQRLKGLTTGGLPTFIDIGNSFGASAIVEDNFIHQLVQNGKRVVMMGDDTWIQLFPHHFNKSYPYPSFNVKDLHTVDNGCVDHLFPSLYEEDWDVLIAHFLGVDHAGHIFGVNSAPMIEKLEQYDLMLEKVIKVLESQSGPGGLHENTFLIVMGDHGQTLNGDHGGGSAEEVETSIFSMSFKKPSSSVPSEFDTSSCELDLDGKKMCISSIEQLDFVVTVSALLGIPFPFGSIGRVNPELYALAAGSWNLEGNSSTDWIKNYMNVLCINSWQVKRYIDVYSASSVMGFSAVDLQHISDLYVEAEKNWLHILEKLSSHNNESCNSLTTSLRRQIDAYSNFLSNVSELARSKWTEFNLKMMGIGLGAMLISLFIIFVALQRVHKPELVSFPSCQAFGASFKSTFAFFMVLIRACSFLSNSYILEEGKVASFLLATIGIVQLRYSIMKRKRLFEAITFLMLISIIRFSIEVGLSKQAATSLFMNVSPSWIFRNAPDHPVWVYVTEIGPILAMILLACLLYETVKNSSPGRIWKCVIMGTITCDMLIAVYWWSESNILSPPLLLQGMARSYIPRIIYAIGLGQLLMLIIGQLFNEEKTFDCKRSLVIKTVAMLSAWSSTIIILSGKQGSFFALGSIIGACTFLYNFWYTSKSLVAGYCIMRLESMEEDALDGTSGILTFNPLSVTQWNLLAVCLFFATGHWCAFDGLRYGAAFIGFDEFTLFRQAILLTVETFGFSHILPIFGLPFLAMCKGLLGETVYGKSFLIAQLSRMYMMYGLIAATTVTATIICVTIQRRHLMVWGLFAPKFVFDVVGLIITDVLIYLSVVFYSNPPEGNDSQNQTGTQKSS